MMAKSAQRALTSGEIALARPAFGEKIAYDRVRISDGPGNNFAAIIAFAKGNPAITLGSTIYFKEDHSPDFSRSNTAGKKSFMHEMMHILQYRQLGQVPFLARYFKEVAEAGFKPDDMYIYKAGETPFIGAMLEAQAEMLMDYSEALWTGNVTRKAELAKNLARSGLYGL
jgi:hypothetical protein